MPKSLSASENNFPSFIDVKVVRVDLQQSANFTHKWVQVKETFESQQLTPKLQDSKLTNKLAQDPLLTLLCLVFTEKSALPAERSQIYKEGLEILLTKWDKKHQMARDWVYKHLSLQQKQDLLSQIALKTFNAGDYFFKQELEQHIANYICNLPDAQTHPEVLELDSEVVAKAIALQHGLLVEQVKGVYSFSDSRLHQYFTARGIIESSDPKTLEQALQNLVSHITEPRWREVFLLAVEMLQNADYLLNLIKQQANAFVASDTQLQYFLAWLNQKSHTGIAFCKPSTFRALYLELILDFDLTAGDRHAYDFDLNFVRRIYRYRHELQNFPFSQQQKQILKQYYNANKLLLDCLSHARYVTRTVRAEIEQNLLIPSESNSETGSAIA